MIRFEHNRIDRVFNSLTSMKIWNPSLLVLTFLIAFCVPLFPENSHSFIYSLLFSLIFLVSALCVGKNNLNILYIAVIAMLMEWISEIMQLSLLHKISYVWNILFFYYVTYRLISMIAKARHVTKWVIMEAINAYLMMGIAFTIVIAILMRAMPEAIAFKTMITEQTTAANLNEYMYFTFVTISTLGYGDVVPIEPIAKSLATIISISGQLYLAIIIAMLVGKLSSADGAIEFDDDSS